MMYKDVFFSFFVSSVPGHLHLEHGLRPSVARQLRQASLVLVIMGPSTEALSRRMTEPWTFGANIIIIDWHLQTEREREGYGESYQSQYL